MKVKSFRDLEVWQEAKSITVQIYKLTSEYSFSKDFSIRDQLRRAAVSIPSNIAEGFERGNTQFAYFLTIAIGSCSELITQLEVVIEIRYSTEELMRPLIKSLETLSARIAALELYLKSRKITSNKQPVTN